MANEIAKQTPVDYAQILRDKIRSEFASLIPEDQWKSMIEAEIKNFTTPTRKQSYGTCTDEPSPFQVIIRTELANKFRVMVQDALSSEFTTSTFANIGGAQTVSESIKQLAVAAAPEILSTLVQGIVLKSMETLRSQSFANTNF